MKVAIMQPYFFPYLGYFQLINEVECFVFYEDVNWINRGWINRNSIIVNKQASLITVPCKDTSQNKKINTICHGLDRTVTKKLLKTIEHSYKKAPFFEKVYPLLEDVLRTESNYIADISISSIKIVSNYLKIDVDFKKSSDLKIDDKFSGGDRLIKICKSLKSKNYINPIGGKNLYDKSYFQASDISLNFLQMNQVEYPQNNESFVANLSIIDLIMNVDPSIIKNKYLNEYTIL